MRLAEALLALGIFGGSCWLTYQGVRALAARASGFRREREPWEVNKHPTPEGGWEVTVERLDERRVVAELPPSPSMDMQTELALALDDAKSEAKLLNRKR